MLAIVLVDDSLATTGPLSSGTTAFVCTVEGTFPHPAGCTQYINCRVIGGIMRVYEYTCPAGSYFDKVRKLCTQGTC